MELLTAYYSVVRFVPDLIKNEAINLGVILVCPSQKFGGCRFPINFSRLKNFFPDVDNSLVSHLIRDLKKKFIFQKQPSLYGTKLISSQFKVDYLEYLGKSFQYMFQFTEPRVTLTADLQSELDDLYDQFVNEERLTGAVRQRSRLLKTEFKEILKKHQLLNKVERNIKIEAKAPFTIDFKFTNGQANLIQPISFSPKENQKGIYETAVVWQYNFKQIPTIEQYQSAKVYALIRDEKHDLKLSEIAKEIISESKVEILDFEKELQILISKIEKEAHIV